MEILLIKQEKEYIELPVGEIISYRGQTIEHKTLVPYEWIDLPDGTKVFLKKDKDRFFLRNGEITVDADSGNVVIPNMNIKVIFKENRAIFYKQEAKLPDEIYLNGKRKTFENTVLDLEYTEGDIFLISNIEITLWKDKIKINGNLDRYKADLEEWVYHESLTEETIHYRRSPRLIMNVPDDRVVIHTPPDKAHFSKRGILQMILPPLVMIILTVAMSRRRS